MSLNHLIFYGLKITRSYRANFGCDSLAVNSLKMDGYTVQVMLLQEHQVMNIKEPSRKYVNLVSLCNIFFSICF
uniref:Uncharacterized protein n=1 Tax=Rhizophora mucronata TaxID=61149 RepID=A0A2P2IY07_RHIMU